MLIFLMTWEVSSYVSLEGTLQLLDKHYALKQYRIFFALKTQYEQLIIFADHFTQS